MTAVKGPAARPCESCPYRTDVPSGVWAASEYAKLPLYDLPTPLQPTALFLCHQNNGRVCAGWCGAHDGEQLLALRAAGSRDDMAGDDVLAAMAYISPVPVFPSGADAARHGTAEIDNPGPAARRLVEKIVRGWAR